VGRSLTGSATTRARQLLGLLTGKPMSLSPFQLPFGGLVDNSNSSDNNSRFNLMAGFVSRKPAPPSPSP
jgi:hypothetical protein